MTRVAIFDPFSGVAGDMTLGALVDVGLDAEWLRALPVTLGLQGIAVRAERVKRGEIAGWKVDFDIPPQPHGRHLRQIKSVVDASPAPTVVKERAVQTFEAIAGVEAEIHGTTVEKVHLHEVGAVDAILDVMGSVWGLHVLGVDHVYCGTIALGDGFVNAAHGRLAVPVPATLRLLEGFAVSSGPVGSGELTTPTGAALMKVLSRGAVPSVYRVIRSGYGAGTRQLEGCANVLRVVLADLGVVDADLETLVQLAADIDDMPAEYLAATADALRDDGALDVTLLQTVMKRGRPGIRIEALCRPADADQLKQLLFRESSTIGVRWSTVS
ncbi:MAG TPA: nickel pincer cofactor biosynthesis protein LarC, partial [Gemmatimonadaceae bacterium]|nr:nickel pincer cofactor biosynthesis protein LarC [Gemmatimonadaceae bacterium]